MPIATNDMNAFSKGQPSHHHNLWRKLLRMLSLTRERELTCSEAQELMDSYVELELAGENPQIILPEVAQHLRICPECREEHDALLKILKMDEG